MLSLQSSNNSGTTKKSFASVSVAIFYCESISGDSSSIQHLSSRLTRCSSGGKYLRTPILSHLTSSALSSRHQCHDGSILYKCGYGNVLLVSTVAMPMEVIGLTLFIELCALGKTSDVISYMASPLKPLLQLDWRLRWKIRLMCRIEISATATEFRNR